MYSVSSPYLAMRDWLHEFRLSVCAVLALASMLTPLLILHGVHTGVISGLKERLKSDPSVLVIMPESTPPGGFREPFFIQAVALSETQFCLARTRDVAAELQLISKNGVFLTVTLEPTASGDPVLVQAGMPIPQEPEYKDPLRFDAVFSHTAAQKLKVQSGDFVEGALARRMRDGRREQKSFVIKVVGILPASSTGMDTIFMRLSLLQAIQDFRDGFAVPLFGAAGETPPVTRTYESFRMYAKKLEDVESLNAWFQQQDLSVRTKVKEIANIRKLDDSLQIVVFIIAVTAGAGFLAFMFSSMHAAVRRKEKMLGMMRLLGYTGWALLLYPITQAMLTASLGVLLAFFLYGIVAYGLDALFAVQSGGMSICHIIPWHFPLIFLGTAVLSAFASLQAAQRAANIEPSTVIREV